MEDWRRTAKEVSVQNLIHIEMTTDAVQAIDVAHDHFALAAEVCGRFRPGLALTGDEFPPLYASLDHVISAIHLSRRLSSCHAGSRHVLSSCAARIGLQGIAPWWWQRWEGHHADAAAHADMALEWLRSAWSLGRAACYAINTIRVGDAWAPAAEQLLRRANDDLAMARAALERMRPAVVAKFSDAWILLAR